MSKARSELAMDKNNTLQKKYNRAYGVFSGERRLVSKARSELAMDKNNTLQKKYNRTYSVFSGERRLGVKQEV